MSRFSFAPLLSQRPDLLSALGHFSVAPRGQRPGRGEGGGGDSDGGRLVSYQVTLPARGRLQLTAHFASSGAAALPAVHTVLTAMARGARTGPSGSP